MGTESDLSPTIDVFVCRTVVPVQGLKDLVWLPIEQYRKDGRIVRGFQRGAASFGTSTAMAALELTNRMVQTIQVLHCDPMEMYRRENRCLFYLELIHTVIMLLWIPGVR